MVLGVCLLGVAGRQAPNVQPLEVRTTVPDGRFIRPDAGLDLRLSRPLTPTDGRLAVVIADVDWTSLFTVDGRTVSYRDGPARLPQGQSTVAVYLVTLPNTWHQIATLTIHVTTPSGFEQVKLAPTADFSDRGQDLERHRPASNAPSRSAFQDFTSHLGFSTEHLRNGVRVTTQTNVLAVSNRTQALRFGEVGSSASRVDLSDYVWSVEARRVAVTVGTVTFNIERHLAANFATRGMSATARLPRLDVTVAAVNGQSIVGFDNFAGVSVRHNRVALAVVGADLLRGRSGRARLEAAFVDGARLARSGATQGSISDVTRSHGESLRFVGSDPAGRLHLDTGVARSWSTNPADPLLSQGSKVVAVRPKTSNASYVDASYDLIRDRKLGAAIPVTLSGSYRFERVDPLFTSVAVPQGARSDLLQNTVGLDATLGQIRAQVSQALSHDNLGHVASILRTDTRETRANLTVPTGTFGQRAATASWWPVVSYTLDRSGQVGEGVPANGGFASASQVPDQLNTVQTLGLDWNFARWRAGYSMNHSFQDNRQPGRETADFANLVQTVSVGLTPTAALDLTLTADHETADNREAGQVSRTIRGGLTFLWHPDARSTVNAIVNRTVVRDPAAGPSTDSDVSLEYTYAAEFRARGVARPRLQLFGRWTWQSSNARDLIFGAVTDRRSWVLTTGLTISVF